MESLEKHIKEIKLNPQFDGIDFKLASCDQPTDNKIIRECGFDSLSIRVVKVLLLIFNILPFEFIVTFLQINV